MDQVLPTPAHAQLSALWVHARLAKVAVRRDETHQLQDVHRRPPDINLPPCLPCRDGRWSSVMVVVVILPKHKREEKRHVLAGARSRHGVSVAHVPNRVHRRVDEHRVVECHHGGEAKVEGVGYESEAEGAEDAYAHAGALASCRPSRAEQEVQQPEQHRAEDGDAEKHPWHTPVVPELHVVIHQVWYSRLNRHMLKVVPQQAAVRKPEAARAVHRVGVAAFLLAQVVVPPVHARPVPRVALSVETVA
mmetsp:Transcript_11720/g.38787  ORF Transcript_11720/g.38787 Transcript_11720/m.38787 type:complete len:248 (-) Transcript_11720:980-1723(-)